MDRTLLANIPADLFQHYVAPLADIKGNTSELLKLVPGAKEDQLYYKRKVETIFKKKIGPDNSRDKDAYKVDWEVVYNAVKNEKGAPGLLSVTIDDPEYIELALDLGAKLSDKDNIAIKTAASNNNIRILKRLLEDTTGDKESTPDPTVGFSYALRIAATKGNIEAVKILLKDPRVNPRKTSDTQEDILRSVIREATETDNIKLYQISDLLMRDERVRPLFTFYLHKDAQYRNSLPVKFWIGLLENIYDFNIDRNNIQKTVIYEGTRKVLDDGSYSLIELYKVILSANDIINDYQSHFRKYTNSRYALGKYLGLAMNLNSFDTYKYLVKLGAPITFKDILVLSIRKWGLKALSIIDKKRITYYMHNADRANSLIDLLIDLKDDNLASYVIYNDERVDKYKSKAYTKLLNYYGTPINKPSVNRYSRRSQRARNIDEINNEHMYEFLFSKMYN